MNDPAVGNDALFWLLDPNPYPDTSIKHWTDGALISGGWCNNDAFHFSPDPANVEIKDTVWASCMMGLDCYSAADRPALNGKRKGKLCCHDWQGKLSGVDPPGKCGYQD